MRIQNTELPILYEQRSKRILCRQSDTINQKTCFERQSQVKNTTKAPEQVLQSYRKKKTWPCNKKKEERHETKILLIFSN